MEGKKTSKKKKKKNDEIFENFKNISHGEQREFLAKITDQTEQFTRQENNSSNLIDSVFNFLSDLAESLREDVLTLTAAK